LLGSLKDKKAMLNTIEGLERARAEAFEANNMPEKKDQNKENKLMEKLAAFDQKNDDVLKEGHNSQRESEQNALLNADREKGHEKDKENQLINVRTDSQNEEIAGKGDGLKKGPNNVLNDGRKDLLNVKLNNGQPDDKENQQINIRTHGQNEENVGKGNGLKNGPNNGPHQKMEFNGNGQIRRRSSGHPKKGHVQYRAGSKDGILTPNKKFDARRVKRGSPVAPTGLTSAAIEIVPASGQGNAVEEVRKIEQFAVDEFFDENVRADNDKGEDGK
jgi:hypothetical protein